MKKNALEEAAARSLHEELKRCSEREAAKTDIRELNESEQISLSEKIEALPIELRSILYFYYCFSFSPEEIGDLLSADQAGDKLAFAREILLMSMGIDGANFRDQDLRSACEKAMEQEYSAIGCEGAEEPPYSEAFRKKMESILSR